jgi:hypothetical protein
MAQLFSASIRASDSALATRISTIRFILIFLATVSVELKHQASQSAIAYLKVSP